MKGKIFNNPIFSVEKQNQNEIFENQNNINNQNFIRNSLSSVRGGTEQQQQQQTVSNYEQIFRNSQLIQQNNNFNSNPQQFNLDLQSEKNVLNESNIRSFNQLDNSEIKKQDPLTAQDGAKNQNSNEFNFQTKSNFFDDNNEAIQKSYNYGKNLFPQQNIIKSNSKNYLNTSQINLTQKTPRNSPLKKIFPEQCNLHDQSYQIFQAEEEENGLNPVAPEINLDFQERGESFVNDNKIIKVASNWISINNKENQSNEIVQNKEFNQKENEPIKLHELIDLIDFQKYSFLYLKFQHFPTIDELKLRIQMQINNFVSIFKESLYILDFYLNLTIQNQKSYEKYKTAIHHFRTQTDYFIQNSKREDFLKESDKIQQLNELQKQIQKGSQETIQEQQEFMKFCCPNIIDLKKTLKLQSLRQRSLIQSLNQEKNQVQGQLEESEKIKNIVFNYDLIYSYLENNPAFTVEQIFSEKDLIEDKQLCNIFEKMAFFEKISKDFLLTMKLIIYLFQEKIIQNFEECESYEKRVEDRVEIFYKSIKQMSELVGQNKILEDLEKQINSQKMELNRIAIPFHQNQNHNQTIFSKFQNNCTSFFSQLQIQYNLIQEFKQTLNLDDEEQTQILVLKQLEIQLQLTKIQQLQEKLQNLIVLNQEFLNLQKSEHYIQELTISRDKKMETISSINDLKLLRKMYLELNQYEKLLLQEKLQMGGGVNQLGIKSQYLQPQQFNQYLNGYLVQRQRETEDYKQQLEVILEGKQKQEEQSILDYIEKIKILSENLKEFAIKPEDQRSDQSAQNLEKQSESAIQKLKFLLKRVNINQEIKGQIQLSLNDLGKSLKQFYFEQNLYKCQQKIQVEKIKQILQGLSLLNDNQKKILDSQIDNLEELNKKLEDYINETRGQVEERDINLFQQFQCYFSYLTLFQQIFEEIKQLEQKKICQIQDIQIVKQKILELREQEIQIRNSFNNLDNKHLLQEVVDEFCKQIQQEFEEKKIKLYGEKIIQEFDVFVQNLNKNLSQQLQNLQQVFLIQKVTEIKDYIYDENNIINLDVYEKDILNNKLKIQENKYILQVKFQDFYENSEAYFNIFEQKIKSLKILNLLQSTLQLNLSEKLNNLKQFSQNYNINSKEEFNKVLNEIIQIVNFQNKNEIQTQKEFLEHEKNVRELGLEFLQFIQEFEFDQAVLALINIVNVFERNKNEINIFNQEFNQSLVQFVNFQNQFSQKIQQMSQNFSNHNKKFSICPSFQKSISIFVQDFLKLYETYFPNIQNQNVQNKQLVDYRCYLEIAKNIQQQKFIEDVVRPEEVYKKIISSFQTPVQNFNELKQFKKDLDQSIQQFDNVLKNTLILKSFIKNSAIREQKILNKFTGEENFNSIEKWQCLINFCQLIVDNIIQLENSQEYYLRFEIKKLFDQFYSIVFEQQPSQKKIYTQFKNKLNPILDSWDQRFSKSNETRISNNFPTESNQNQNK